MPVFLWMKSFVPVVLEGELLDYAKSVKKELSLSVYKKNQAAARFYLRNGFEISSEAEDEATGEIEMLMRWKNDE